MSNEDLILILEQIDNSVELVIERSSSIESVDDFTSTPEGMMRLDSICMQLVTIGESVKSIDKYTNKSLLPHYSNIDWRGVMGLRDIIVHQYFNVDVEVIYDILKMKIPTLSATIKLIISDLIKNI